MIETKIIILNTEKKKKKLQQKDEILKGKYF